MKDNRLFFLRTVFVVLLGLLTYHNFQLREFDWDLPGYLGAVYQIDGNNSRQIHQKVYSVLKTEIPSKDFEKITNNNGYRKGVYNDAVAFNLQIPYYSVKSGYVLPIYLLYKMGISSITAVLIVSALSYFLVGFFLFEIFFFLTKKIVLTTLLSLFILLLPPLRYMSQIATPDMLAFLFLIAFFYLFLKRKYFILKFIIMLVLTLVRPDYIIFAAGFYVFQFILERQKKSILYVGILMLVYLINSRIYDYPGWESLFYDSFIHRRINISTEPVRVSLLDYINVLLKNLMNFKKVTFLAVLLLTVVLLLSQEKYSKYLTVFLFLNIYLKFLLFPAAGDLRFYIPFLVLMFLMVIKAIFQKYPNLFQPRID